MRTRPARITFHIKSLDTAILAAVTASLARAVTEVNVEIGPLDRAHDAADDRLRMLVTRFPNLRVLNLRRWHYDSVLENLPPLVALSNLTTLCLGCESAAALALGAFFEMLSMMPALKKLAFGTLEMPDDLYGDSFARDLYVRSLLQPACRLTHLVVNDDADINFRHYPLLLSRSHDTLEHLGLHWIFDPEVANDVREALLQCTRVRHLSLEGNCFDNEPIISACPRLQSLMLTSAPTEAEMAALHAPLCSLELANCFSDTPEQYVALVSRRLRDVIAETPSLGTICFNFLSRQLQHETEEYRELRALCRERRIHLSTVPPPRVVYF